MKIKLLTPHNRYKTEIDTEQIVVIENPARGPIITNGEFCISIMARDAGFEGFAWYGSANIDENAPVLSFEFSIVPEEGTLVMKSTPL